MSKAIIYNKGDMIGRHEYAQAVAIKNYGNSRGLFKCSFCGEEFESDVYEVKRDRKKSCGCMAGRSIANPCKWGDMIGTKTYTLWTNIKTRCYNKKLPYFECYGGRGIRLHDEWKNDFLAFHNYVSKLHGYGQPRMSLDRINNNGDYEPGNVRWTTNHVQKTNQRKFKEAIDFIGVSPMKSGNGYYAYITVNCLYHYLGSSQTKHGAAELRNNFIIKNGLWEYPVHGILDYMLN